MTTANTSLPTFVKATLQNRAPFWVKPQLLFDAATPAQQKQIFSALFQNRVVYVEDEDMNVEIAPMPVSDKKRLTQLTSFQRDGFLLASF